MCELIGPLLNVSFLNISDLKTYVSDACHALETVCSAIPSPNFKAIFAKIINSTCCATSSDVGGNNSEQALRLTAPLWIAYRFLEKNESLILEFEFATVCLGTGAWISSVLGFFPWANSCLRSAPASPQGARRAELCDQQGVVFDLEGTPSFLRRSLPKFPGRASLPSCFLFFCASCLPQDNWK